MFIRTSPNLCEPLAGKLIGFGAHKRSEHIVTSSDKQNQAKPKNFCNHNPKDMRGFDRPLHHKKRYELIENCIEKLTKALEFPNILEILFCPKKKKRSQRREAMVRVLQVMLHYMDMES